MVDIPALHAALDVERAERGLTWRAIAAEMRISPSTLSRLAQGLRPDVDGFAAMILWLGVPAERFFKPEPSQEPVSPIVEAVVALRTSPQLSRAEAEVLERVLLGTYEALRLDKLG